MIPQEQVVEIRRLFYAEHWKVGTIATQLGLHHDAVQRAIHRERFVTPGRVMPSALDPFRPFIEETLGRFPRLTATRLHEMLRGRGYPGSVVQVRRLVRHVRPHPAPQAYLRLQALPGEQAQVDGGSFGTLRVGRAERRLSCFVLVLSYSRGFHAEFTLDQSLESFLAGHVHAFETLGGVARQILYDNLKSVVLERQGDAVRFHPRLLELAAHYHYVPRPCAPYRANEKGRAERLIGYLRQSFFAARSFRDLDDLNHQLARWRDEIALARPWPDDRERTVAAMFAAEQPRLLPLPEHPFETDLVTPVRVGKTPYVRFDGNGYSVPHTLVRKALTLVASRQRVRLLDGTELVAEHGRSYDRGRLIEDPAHVAALWDEKRAAAAHRGRGRLLDAVPRAEALFEELAQRGENLGSQTRWLLQLLDQYGAAALGAAIERALARGTPTAASVAHLLELERRRQNRRPAAPVVLPDNPRVRDLRVTPHRLESYDELGRNDDSDDHRHPGPGESLA